MQLNYLEKIIRHLSCLVTIGKEKREEPRMIHKKKLRLQPEDSN
jgi:hypothetical protein